MRAAEQRHDLAFGEDDPVAVAGVHGRDDEPLGKRVQDLAEDQQDQQPGRSLWPGEQIHE